MFGGVVRVMADIRQVRDSSEGRAFVLAAQWQDAPAPQKGDSICCHGICLSVVDAHNDAITVEASPTTLQCTTAAQWREGDVIHCERALVVGTDRLEGHILFGHVDGVAQVVAMEKQGEGRLMQLRLPPALMPLMAARGSLAVNGISLTIAALNDDDSTVTCALIPLTCRMTTLATLAVGDEVNIEADMIARYVARARDLS